MHRFFVERENIKDDEIVLCGDNAAHASVLRLRRGEKIVAAINGEGLDYHCIVTQLNRDEACARIVDKKPNNAELPINITLFQALPKGDKMSDIIEHATELGITEIVPITTSRCVAKPADKPVQKIMRWQKIAESAAKLCHRGLIPKIGNVVPLLQAIHASKTFDITFVCYESEEDNHIIPFLKNSDLNKIKRIAFFIGPEGGFATDEIIYLEKHGITALSLGSRILRTQSAAALVISYINYALDF